MISQNRCFSVLILIALVFLLFLQPGLAQQDGDPITIGAYRVIHSQILDEDRLLLDIGVGPQPNQ